MLWVHVTQLHVCTLPGKCLRSSDLSLLTDSASNHVRCHVPSCKTCCRHQKVPIRSTADMGATFSSKSCGKEERPLSRITSSLLERVVIPSLAALRDDRGLCATGELCELRDGERDVGNRLDDVERVERQVLRGGSVLLEIHAHGGTCHPGAGEAEDEARPVLEDEADALVFGDSLIDRVVVREHVGLGNLHPACSAMPSQRESKWLLGSARESGGVACPP
mmetsp:Transcript_19855/g.34788  ORF Transcript_19855/g.34788 Transcript_19855/m.34788 type:complete len:221 (+) Transcript_19855:112-774(+)